MQKASRGQRKRVQWAGSPEAPLVIQNYWIYAVIIICIINLLLTYFCTQGKGHKFHKAPWTALITWMISCCMSKRRLFGFNNLRRSTSCLKCFWIQIQSNYWAECAERCCPSVRWLLSENNNIWFIDGVWYLFCQLAYARGFSLLMKACGFVSEKYWELFLFSRVHCA